MNCLCTAQLLVLLIVTPGNVQACSGRYYQPYLQGGSSDAASGYISNVAKDPDNIVIHL